MAGWRFWLTQPPGAAPRPWWVRGLNAALVALALAGVLTFAFSQILYHWNWAGLWRYRVKLREGWLMTVYLALAALVLSTLLGAGAALARRSAVLALRYAGTLYVELVRGTPLLVQILVAFYVVAEAFGLQNRFAVGVLALSFFTGAYLCEIFRAGLEGIPRSQWESARALGLTVPQAYRYVVLPQALRHVLPPVAGQFASLIKDSSLLSVIALSEFTQNVQEVNANIYSSLEGFLVLALGYWILTLPISLLSRRWEERVRYET